MSTKEKEIWDDIEIEFVSTDRSLTELAAKFKVAYGTLRRKAHRKQWKDKRAKYREAHIRTGIEDAAHEDEKIKDDFDKASDIVCQVAAAKSAFAMKAYYEDKKELSISAIQGHLNIIKQSQDILYRRLGVPPPKTIIGIEAENAFRTYQERLAIETALLNQMPQLQAGGEVIETVEEEGGNGRMVKDGRLIRLNLIPPEFEDGEDVDAGQDDQSEPDEKPEQGADSDDGA